MGSLGIPPWGIGPGLVEMYGRLWRSKVDNICPHWAFFLHILFSRDVFGVLCIISITP
jgi:hypothetical protein